jgi:tight adherence protein C
MRLSNRVLSAHLPPAQPGLKLRISSYQKNIFVAKNKKALRELPDFTEAVALLLQTGLPVGVALSWLQPRMTGELGKELSIVINNIGLGADLAAELSEAATRIGHEGFHELVEKLSMSLDRGAPVAEQTMQLAYSLRQEQGRGLLRQAGSSETKMLIPTVFVILPVTVLFAVFPSVLVLQQSF